jgi:hypothetical protein
VKHLPDSSLRYRWVQNDIISLKCVSPEFFGRCAEGSRTNLVEIASIFDDVTPVNVATLYWWRRGLSKGVVVELAALLNGRNCMK